MQMYRNIPKEQLSNTLYSKIFRVNGQKKSPNRIGIEDYL
ncbi:Uncharacterised protein [Porphyromonas endodontalis]|nr:Uncharacterised protein [Porphyromonas endodontalis]